VTALVESLLRNTHPPHTDTPTHTDTPAGTDPR
ncbi:hypothetical protein SAMN05444921_14613, partial [Streptomyces wuyuanensis]